MLRRLIWRRRQKLASWTVIATLLLNILSTAVLPGLSSGQANAGYPQAGSEDVLVICTPNGLKLIQLDANGEPVPVEETAENDYCAFCLPFNKPLLSAPTVASVSSNRDFGHDRQPFLRDAVQGIASIPFKPLGSRAPPTCS